MGPMKLAAIALLTMIAGCQTSGGTFCAIAKPHRFTAASIAALSDAEVKQELAFNKTGQKLCGWRP